MKIAKETDAVSKVKHRCNNPVTSLEYACVNKSILYVTTHKRKAPINMLSRSKTPKPQQVEGFTHMRITSTYFSHHKLRWHVENLACLSSYAKAPVPLKSIIHTYILTRQRSRLPLQSSSHKKTQLPLCVVLSYTALRWVTLANTRLHRTTLGYTGLHWATLDYTGLH